MSLNELNTLYSNPKRFNGTLLEYIKRYKSQFPKSRL